MKTRNLTLATLIAILVITTSSWAVTAKFAAVQREPLTPDKDTVFKKTLFISGLTNAAYLGLNDMVAALQLAKDEPDAKTLQAQLLAVKIGLAEKPTIIRYIARQLEFCEKYPNFPLGFDDSPEGPEKLSVEFYKIADQIENMKIHYELTNIKALRKEAERVVFQLFWTDGEMMRTMCGKMLNFIRMELKEDLPFEPLLKPLKPTKK